MSNPVPEIVINGRFLTQPTTGVQRVAREVTRELDHLVSEGEVPLRLRLVCTGCADVSDLDLRVTTVERVGNASGHFWEQVILPTSLRGARLLCLGNTAPLITLVRRQRAALMIHDLSYRLYPEAYSWSYRIGHGLMLPVLLRRANPIITVSDTEKAMLATIAPMAARRIVVARNGGWRDFGANEVQQECADASAMTGGEISDGAAVFDVGERPYILYVGSFSQRKNWDGVLAAVIRLAREDGMPAVLVGSAGEFLTPSDMAIPDDVGLLINIVGQVEDLARLGALYRGAVCLLFPSFYEASPLPPLEAMRFGCPVVGSNIPSMRERCGDAAQYCDPFSVDDIIAAVRRVIHDPSRRKELIENGNYCSARYSWRAQAREIARALLDSTVS